MKKFDTKKYPIYASFLNQLAKDLTKFYYAKLDKPFKITNKMKGKGYDPVTTSDKAFEKFIRSKISKKFPNHQIIGEEYGHKNTKSEFSWVIDPIDGTRSYVVGNPSWSNLISLNYNGEPILGLANFPKMRKYYLNVNKNLGKFTPSHLRQHMALADPLQPSYIERDGKKWLEDISDLIP